uniref:Cyclin, domain containing protein n=1 Tax=Entamoeba histolytica TaxID=5759 RepID=S0AVK0_ENTHI|nr:cyclin, domain containing protein [Entamoeba histolytica]
MNISTKPFMNENEQPLQQPNQLIEKLRGSIESVPEGIDRNVSVKVDENSHYVVTLPNEINPYKICRRCQEYISSEMSSFKSDLTNLVDCGLSQYCQGNGLNEDKEIFSNDGCDFSIDKEKFLYLVTNSEREFMSNFYAEKGRTVNGSMRAKVIQMLMEENSHETNFIIDQAVAIFDHFLAVTPNFAVESLQLLGYVAYDIASKMDRFNSQILYMCNSRLMWSEQEVYDFELTVLDTLYFKTTYVTIYSFFTQLLNLFDIILPPSFNSTIIFPYVYATLLSSEFLNTSVPILGTFLLLYCINQQGAFNFRDNEFYEYILPNIKKICDFYNISFNKLEKITDTISSFTQFLLKHGQLPNFQYIQQVFL